MASGASLPTLTPTNWKSDGLHLTQLWLILSDYAMHDKACWESRAEVFTLSGLSHFLLPVGECCATAHWWSDAYIVMVYVCVFLRYHCTAAESLWFELWNFAHPSCKTQIDGIFNQSSNFGGFCNQSASFKRREVGGWGATAPSWSEDRRRSCWES